MFSGIILEDTDTVNIFKHERGKQLIFFLCNCTQIPTDDLTIVSAASWSMICPEGPATWYIDIAAQAEIWVTTCSRAREWSRDGEMVNGVYCIIASLQIQVLKKTYLEVGIVYCISCGKTFM